MLPLRYPRLWATVAWLLVAFAFVASLLPGAPNLGGSFINDKVLHGVGYLSLTLWFTGLYARKHYAWIVVGLLAMGALIELIQGAMSLGRQREAADMIANAVGISVGTVLALIGLGGWVARVERVLSRS